MGQIFTWFICSLQNNEKQNFSQIELLNIISKSSEVDTVEKGYNNRSYSV